MHLTVTLREILHMNFVEALANLYYHSGIWGDLRLTGNQSTSPDWYIISYNRGNDSPAHCILQSSSAE